MNKLGQLGFCLCVGNKVRVKLTSYLSPEATRGDVMYGLSAYIIIPYRITIHMTNSVDREELKKTRADYFGSEY
jgi:hypothetical protein